MPDVQVTTDATAVFAIVAVIGGLAIVAVVVSFWAARFADAPSASPALPYEPPAAAGEPILPVPATQPAQRFGGVERSHFGVDSPTLLERIALFAIVGVVAALLVAAVIVALRD